MTGVPILFRPHALGALLLFTVWPFTRLVHILTALGRRTPRRGWEPLR